jgi:membrane associated rhomboid family serine protease
MGAGMAMTWLLRIRNALIVMGAFMAIIWILQVFNWTDSYRLDYEYGIMPRNVGSLSDIFTAPFLHASWTHIEGNSVPLLVLGVLAAYRSIVKFLFATLIIVVTSGMAVWLFQSGNSVTIGASGVVFGYFGYVLVRGLIDRNWLDIGLGVLAGLLFYGILAVAMPGTPGVSWIDHVGGLVGGVAAAWMLRTPAAQRVRAGKPKSVTADAPGPQRPQPSPAGKSVDDLLRDLKNQGF